jgi:hypothetical protein
VLERREMLFLSERDIATDPEDDDDEKKVIERGRGGRGEFQYIKFTFAQRAKFLLFTQI